MSDEIQRQLWAEYFRMKQMSYDELYKLRQILVALDKPFIVHMVDMAIQAKAGERNGYKQMIT